jgi:hypothetical protein
MEMRAQTVALGAAAATSVALGAAAAYTRVIAPWWRSWGVRPVEAAAVLPGDDVVPDATVTDTRGLDIDAPPEAVWPWLIQMGYGRAGWYSYDAMDMRGHSADQIEPSLQRLEVGDLVPTSPTTGFAVKVLEPGRALVLSIDEHLIEEQAAAAHKAELAGESTDEAPANLKLAGAAMPAMPGFAASWAFVLTALDGGTRTRLEERVRVKMAPVGSGSHFAMSAFGFAVFLMTRKQMLGLKERAERGTAREPVPTLKLEVAS